MKTILELIESWKPCHRYNDYIRAGHLHAGMTIDDILRSAEISSVDKGWFFDKLFRGRFGVLVYSDRVWVVSHRHDYVYSYETFLAMIDEYLEHANIDAAI